jgi:glycosyltransferase involved in cell wall biosynthesis
MTDVVIAHQTIAEGDAIGHDIMGMYDALNELGYNASLYAEYCFGRPCQLRRSSSKLRSILSKDDTILIYHHSIHWEAGEKVISKFKGKVIFKYHNITPPDFFRKFSDLHYYRCSRGIEQTKRLIEEHKNAIWWADSKFNNADLTRIGLEPDKCVVVPPFNLIDELDAIEPNFDLIDSLISNKKNNVLFVGRVAPNKGHTHLIETINAYKNTFDSNIHLWIVGALDNDNSRPYNDHLKNLIKEHGLDNDITFLDKQPIENLKAYYLGCDEFLCASEHEGFCVPIIEAQKLNLPVIIFWNTALSETVGRNQIVLKSRDYNYAASALYTVYTEEKIRKFCRKYGFFNYESRFKNSAIKEIFISALNNIRW